MIWLTGAIGFVVGAALVLVVARFRPEWVVQPEVVIKRTLDKLEEGGKQEVSAWLIELAEAIKRIDVVK